MKRQKTNLSPASAALPPGDEHPLLRALSVNELASTFPGRGRAGLPARRPRAAAPPAPPTHLQTAGRRQRRGGRDSCCCPQAASEHPGPGDPEEGDTENVKGDLEMSSGDLT